MLPTVAMAVAATATGDAAFYVDGKFIAGGPVPAKEAAKSNAELIFGDGSNEVGGRVEIGYLKAGRLD